MLITFRESKKSRASSFVPPHDTNTGTSSDISKIEGRFEEYVKNALRELLNLIHKTYGKDVLKRSEKTIQNLMRRL